MIRSERTGQWSVLFIQILRFTMLSCPAHRRLIRQPKVGRLRELLVSKRDAEAHIQVCCKQIDRSFETTLQLLQVAIGDRLHDLDNHNQEGLEMAHGDATSGQNTTSISHTIH